MSDHAINIALLVVAIISGLFEGSIWWMIRQENRSERSEIAMTESQRLSRKTWLGLGLLSFGPLLALLVIYLFSSALRSASVQSTALTPIPTSLELQFDASGVAHSIKQQNLFNWYALTMVVPYVDVHNKQGDVRAINLFIAFKNEVAIKEVKIDSHGVALPDHEVKLLNTRYMIIAFYGPITNTIMSIEGVT